MIKVYNIFILAKGFRCLTVWPFVFVRLEERRNYGERDERHEGVHGEQQKEMLMCGCAVGTVMALCGLGWWSLLALPLFFWWYLAEWLVRLVLYRFDATSAYRNISFEQEAFMNQLDREYLPRRRSFAWTRYLTRKTYDR